MACVALLQGTFLTQGLNPSDLHCSQILYLLSHQGSPKGCEHVLKLIELFFSDTLSTFYILLKEKLKIVLFIFYFLATPHGTWDLSSLARDRTCVPCIGNMGS